MIGAVDDVEGCAVSELVEHGSKFRKVGELFVTIALDE